MTKLVYLIKGLKNAAFGLCLVFLLCSGCKRNDSLFPVAGAPPITTTTPDPPAKDSTKIQVPDFSTNWGDSIELPVLPAGTFSVLDYGGSTKNEDNATNIQAAIDAASAQGGGTVHIPAGTFNCGPIVLKSNVGLHLDKDAVLKVLNYKDYPGAGTTSAVAAFIDLSNTSNVLIDGEGTVDGQGEDWWVAYRAAKSTGGIARPPMISFDKATKVEIAGITIKNAPNGHISIHKSNSQVTISGVTLISPDDSPNTDGIDVWSPYVNILHCNISCGDDNIAMNNNTQYVTIANCVFGKGHGLSIGSYTANIDHIYVHDCSFEGTDNGVHIKSSRGRSGQVGYLVYDHLTMTGVSTPINICEYYPDNTIPSTASADPAQEVTASTPVWGHIILKNIVATDASNAGMIWAVPEMPIQDLILDNVQITAKTGIKINNVQSAAFIHVSQIKVGTGKAVVSSFGSTITGIDLTTGIGN